MNEYLNQEFVKESEENIFSGAENFDPETRKIESKRSNVVINQYIFPNGGGEKIEKNF